jgi:hypothetical protein
MTRKSWSRKRRVITKAVDQGRGQSTVHRHLADQADGGGRQPRSGFYRGSLTCFRPSRQHVT